MRVSFIAFCVFAVWPFTGPEAAVLVKKDGTRVPGTVIERAGDYVVMDVQGFPVTYWADEVERIEEEEAKDVAVPADHPAAGILTAEGEAKDKYLALTAMGEAFMELKDYENALSVFLKAVKLDNQDALIFQKMGDCSAGLGRYKEALVFAQRAVELDPRNGDLLMDLAMSYAAVKRFEEARKALDDARKVLAGTEALSDLAYVEEGLKEMEAGENNGR